MTDDTLFDIDLAVEEASTNIVRHAYGYDRAGDMQVRVKAVDDAVWITLTDWGLPFDPDSVTPFDVDALVETRAEGGFGLRIIDCLMDDVVRETASAPGGPNILVLRKHLEHPRAP